MSPDLAMRTRSRLWIALAMAGLVVSACSSGDAPESATVSTDPAATAAVDAAPSPTEDVRAQESADDDAAVVPTEQVEPEDPQADAEVETAPAATAQPELEGEQSVDGPVDSADTTQSDDLEAGLDGVLTDIVADAQGGRAFFDGRVDEEADLEDLVLDAWGDGGLGLHRGHAQVENVLEAFLGINHDGMHDYMDQGLNLAATAEALNKNPEALVASLTNSYIPFINQGVDNGVINAEQADDWIQQLRVEFNDRVYWDGISES